LRQRRVKIGKKNNKKEIKQTLGKHLFILKKIRRNGHPNLDKCQYLLIFLKPYFLYNSTQISKFPKLLNENEQLFVWIDAGYGHGSKSAIPLGIWKPNKINKNKINLIKLPTHGENVKRYTLDRVF
jgi:hypothetical protein